MMIETNLNNFFVFQAQEFGFGENSKDFILTANNIFRQLYRRCSCGSNKVIHNGYKSDERIIIKELGLVIKRGQCVCRACGATWIIRPEEVDIWVKTLKQIINNEIISLVANKLSFEKTAKHIKNIYGKDISIEWIRQLYDRAIKKLRRNKPKTVSGYFNYDEQHIKENGEEVVRITIIDAIKKDVILDKKAEELLEEVKAMINLYPKKLVNRIRKIIEHWDKFSLGLRDIKVPLTNNNIEQYYSATLHQVEKRRFRSEEAIETRLKVSVLKNNKRKLFNKVNFMGFYS